MSRFEASPGRAIVFPGNSPDDFRKVKLRRYTLQALELAGPCCRAVGIVVVVVMFTGGPDWPIAFTPSVHPPITLPVMPLESQRLPAPNGSSYTEPKSKPLSDVVARGPQSAARLYSLA